MGRISNLILFSLSISCGGHGRGKMGNPCHFSGFQNLSHVKKFQEENNKQTGVRTGTCGNPLAQPLNKVDSISIPLVSRPKWTGKFSIFGLWRLLIWGYGAKNKKSNQYQVTYIFFRFFSHVFQAWGNFEISAPLKNIMDFFKRKMNLSYF